ncbi:hypothetical protein J3Q64DRAFT_1231691 [Phycomyces blakesleeanus]|uniref:Bromo domain-containing protein n=1 Tax=Phycomyces blakesleeanus TaxID=4837 RepID=A0ABR3BA08_PHYBL
MALVGNNTPPSRLPPWNQLSYVLAKDIFKNNLHSEFLTGPETLYFESAVETFTTWLAFMSPARDYGVSVANDTITEPEIVAFRIRSMIFEKFIPHLYHSNRPCCRNLHLDLAQLCESARHLQIPDPAAVAEASIQRKKALTNLKETNHAKTPNSSQNPDEETDNEPAIKVEPPSSLGTIPIEQVEKVPIREIYQTLEYDQAAMIEQKKLQEFEAQEELNEEEEKDNAEDQSLAIFNANGNFNLKYLLQGIAANRQQTSLSDRDLQNLLSDFRPHRSKWANDERPGQEELYEACEKVLNDLKNYTEHSTPFLNKVSKREAPDYFEVIKRPMDLGTITKKLKSLNYKSKKEFSEDLHLIYENCLIYNTNPASEYRKHAIAMRRKTDKLLSRVPDISIKERPEAEIDDEIDEPSEEEDTESHRAFRKAPGSQKHPTASKQRGSTSANHDNLAARGSRERSLTCGSNSASHGVGDGVNMGPGKDENNRGHSVSENGVSHKNYGGKQLKNQNGVVVEIDLEQEEKNVGAEIDGDVGELQDQVWRDMTKKTRAKMTSDIEKQYQFSFGDREAILRSPLDMERFAMLEHVHSTPQVTQRLVRCTADTFSQWTERRGGNASLYDEFDINLSDEENLDAFFSRKIAKPKTEQDDDTRTDLFLPEYIISSGIPEIAGVPEEFIEDEPKRGKQSSRMSRFDDTGFEATSSRPKGYTDVSLDVYPCTSFPKHGLNKLIDRNLHEMQHIRTVYNKCNAVRNNVPISTFASIPLDAVDPVLTSEFVFAKPAPVKPAYTSNPSTSTQPHLPSSSLPPKPASHKAIPPLIMNQDSSQQLTQRTVAKLLAHAGFEGAHTGALNVLTDMMSDYLLNVGKTLRTYWDDYGRQMNGEEIIMHTLYENGVPSIRALESYIHDDIERFGTRLEDLHRKLDSSYQDILSGSTDKCSVDTDALLQDEETFITGSFGEDLGEDYFGFKELGLERDFNLGAYPIPSRLWFGGNKEKAKSTSIANNEPLPKYPPPPPFTPLTSEKELIGLLQPIFRKKLADTPHGLVEDEYLPRNRNRPRYPPINKNSGIGRKKTAKDGSSSGGGSGNGADSKKSKRKRPLEEIKAEKAERAEKKRQKLEERAQRMAEKEQKRKLRDEMKEQERQAKLEAKEKKVRQEA